MLVIQDLDGTTVERAGALVAREHATARQMRPELPASFGGAEFCTATLQRLRDSGHHGLVATGDGRTVAVMTAAGVLSRCATTSALVARVLVACAGGGSAGLYYGDSGGLAWMCCGVCVHAGRFRVGCQGQKPPVRC
jgi:hypothetical protein